MTDIQLSHVEEPSCHDYCYDCPKCKHIVRQWLAWREGVYRLFCVNCGKDLGSETYLPQQCGPYVSDEIYSSYAGGWSDEWTSDWFDDKKVEEK